MTARYFEVEIYAYGPSGEHHEASLDTMLVNCKATGTTPDQAYAQAKKHIAQMLDKFGEDEDADGE